MRQHTHTGTHYAHTQSLLMKQWTGWASLETRPFALRGMVWFHPYQALVLVECAMSAQSMYDNYIH